MSEQDIIMFDSGKGPKEPCFFRVAQFVLLRSCRFRGYLLHAFSFVLPAGTGCHWLVIRYNSWLCVVSARFTWFTAKSWCCSALLISDETTILVFVFELISCLGLFLHTSPPVGAHNPKLVAILKTTCRALVCYLCRCRLNSGYHYQNMQNKALSWTCVHQCKTWTMQGTAQEFQFGGAGAHWGLWVTRSISHITWNVNFQKVRVDFKKKRVDWHCKLLAMYEFTICGIQLWV